MSNFNEIKINTHLNEIDSSFIDQMFLEIDIPSFSFPRSVFRFFYKNITKYKILDNSYLRSLPCTKTPD